MSETTDATEEDRQGESCQAEGRRKRGEMVAEEGAEPSASQDKAGAAPLLVVPPSLPPSAPTASTDAEAAEAVVAAKALQVRDAVLSSQAQGVPSTAAFG